MDPLSLLRRTALIALLGALQPLGAWSPSFHESQTRQALALLPRGMRTYLAPNLQVLLREARGLPKDRVPTVEEVEEQFHRVLKASEERRSRETIARELGTLAHMVQLLTDPSAFGGASLLRDHFEAFADSQTKDLVLTAEPAWATRGAPDPRKRLLELARQKTERLALLEKHFDPQTGKRLVVWDKLSVPFALLQTGRNSGVHATVNLWILAWRMVGDSWMQG